MNVVVKENGTEVFASRIFKIRSEVTNNLFHYKFSIDGNVYVKAFSKDLIYSIQFLDDEGVQLDLIDNLVFYSVSMEPTFNKLDVETEVEFNEAMD